MKPARAIAYAFGEEAFARVVGFAVMRVIGEVVGLHAVRLQQHGEKLARHLVGDDRPMMQVQDVGEISDVQPMMQDARIGDFPAEARLDQFRRRSVFRRTLDARGRSFFTGWALGHFVS